MKTAPNTNEIYKRVNFDEIISLENRENRKHGVIGVTLLTPRQAIHALPTDKEVDHHQYITESVAEQIFGCSQPNPEYYCVEIRYSVRNSANKDALLLIPKYITSKMIEWLEEILALLLSSGFDTTAIFTNIDFANIDPIDYKMIAEANDEEIMAFILKNGMIREYELPFGEAKMAEPDDFEKKF